MEHDQKISHNNLLAYLSDLPKKIVSLEGIEHTPSFVLHELCHERCFNLKKAAFFADSPDFDSLRGVAGFDGAQQFSDANMWQDPRAFIEHLQTHAQFNTAVRGVRAHSLLKSGQPDAQLVQELAHQLGLTNPAVNYWPMKHDNFGVLLYENEGQMVSGMQEQLNNSLYLLNFCPLL